MDHFEYRCGVLHAEDVSLADIAVRYGTPCYVYSKATLERHWYAFDRAFSHHPHLVCYAVKANSNLAILRTLSELGSGFDIVSVGELERVLMAGGDPSKIVFSGVGKREDELLRALEVGIHCFNVEVPQELDRLNAIGKRLNKKVPVSLRVNPDVDAKTHPYISTGLRENKFGIDMCEAQSHYQRAATFPFIEPIGVDCHIGSQLTSLSPFVDALNRVLELADQLKTEGILLEHIDIGGGLGIRYRDEVPPEPTEYASALLRELKQSTYKILIEPGRAIVGNAGVLLTRVEYLKSNPIKQFAIVDAAMNDLLRPALYGAWQEVLPVCPHQGGNTCMYDIVGPVCETSDFLAKERELSLKEGDILAIRSAGAYGFSMSSNYNSRLRPPEVLVERDQVRLIRRRETLFDLLKCEMMEQ